MILRRLHQDGRRLITRDLVSGQLSCWPERAYAELLTEAPTEVDLDAFDRALDETCSKFTAHDAAMDAHAAPLIHRALPMCRRHACDPSAWRFLTVVHRPDFVRHRWQNRSLAAMRAHFWRAGMRHDSNAIGRLWWIAELSRDGDDYTLAKRALASQQLAKLLFSRQLCGYRPAVAACVAELESATNSVVEQTMRRLSKALSTIVLESLDESQLAALVVRLRKMSERDA